jgi:hypothetical protein
MAFTVGLPEFRMTKTSTMKPFAPGDIFPGCTYLCDPDDDHKGDGRILQFDRNRVPKGTLNRELNQRIQAKRS